MVCSTATKEENNTHPKKAEFHGVCQMHTWRIETQYAYNDHYNDKEMIHTISKLASYHLTPSLCTELPGELFLCYFYKEFYNQSLLKWCCFFTS